MHPSLLPAWRSRHAQPARADEVPLRGVSPSGRFVYEVRARALDLPSRAGRTKVKVTHLARVVGEYVRERGDLAALVRTSALDSYLRLIDLDTNQYVDLPLGDYAPTIVAETRMVWLNLLSRPDPEIVEIYFDAADEPEGVLAEVIPLYDVLAEPDPSWLEPSVGRHPSGG